MNELFSLFLEIEKNVTVFPNQNTICRSLTILYIVALDCNQNSPQRFLTCCKLLYRMRKPHNFLTRNIFS